MSIIYDKPFTTVDEQVEILKSRNVIIEDEAYAKRLLTNISYYTLVNGYKKPLLKGPDTFIDGTTIEMLYSIYLIDFDIHSVMLKNILYVERQFKTHLSRVVCGPDHDRIWSDPNSSDITLNPSDYLYRGHYSNGNNRRQSTLSKLKSALMDCKSLTTTEYYKTTKNHVPPWILVNDIPLGLAINWYLILKSDDKDRICNLIFTNTNTLTDSEKRKFFSELLNILRNFRNKIAHGNRTFSSQLPDALSFNYIYKLLDSTALSAAEFNSGMGERDFYAVVISLAICISDSTQYRSLGSDVLNIIRKYGTFDFAGKTVFDIFEIPKDIINRLQNIYIRKNR